MTDRLNARFYEYQQARRANWDQVATRPSGSWGGYYRRYITDVYRQIIPAGSAVLEIGCGRGDLLAALAPSTGVGLDLSPEMIGLAKTRHPGLSFSVGDIHEADLGGQTFDFIILSDVINDLWDLQLVLQRLRPHCRPTTRLVFNFFSQLWKPPFTLAQRFGVATPMRLQNWFTSHDLDNLLELSGYQTLRKWGEIVMPLEVPLLSRIANKVFAKIAPTRWFAMTNFLLARPAPELAPVVAANAAPSVSVIVPARNEAGHIAQLIATIPEMGSGTEIIFVEGNSTDDTYETIQRLIAEHPERNCKLLKQPGKGKGDAVRVGFEAAKGDILMILDADITVPPEDLPRFFDVLVSGHGEFVNGVRLVYPMDEDAMRFLNLLGNKAFSIAFSWLLGQKIRDTLCGTKVIWTSQYKRIAANRAYFGDFDPFGDFDLLFGAAKLNLKIVEIPIRYQARQYGETNIQRWRHGLLLLRMVIFAARRIKFS
ncbi:MAG: glycosyl transferase [Xanthobacteraceae bacterium]|nr:glycosyl transferase [Xanthobacteraceae bacterium]